MPIPNRYSGPCVVCGVTVEPGLGKIERAGSQWVCFCQHHAPKTVMPSHRPVEKKETSQKTLDLD